MDQEVKTISSDTEKRPEQVAKYTAKDSVFTSLFREPKYLLQLYQALHPEDHEATEDSIKNVTITNVLLDQYYNDVGFQIGRKDRHSGRAAIELEHQYRGTLSVISCPDLSGVF